MKRFLNIKLLYAFLLLISFSILVYFCLDDNNLITLLDTVSILNIVWLSIACASMFLVWIIDAIIVKILTSSIYDKKYYLKDAFKVTMVGQFFNSVTPFCVASQPMQILTMSGQGISAGSAISVVVRKFLIYQSTLVLYLISAMLFSFNLFIDRIPDFMPLVFLGCFSQSAIILVIIFFTVKKEFTLKIISNFFHLLSHFNIIKEPEKKLKTIEKQLNLYVENNKEIGKNLNLTLKVFILTFLQFTVMFNISFCVYKAFNNPGFDFLDMISGQAFVMATSAYMPLPGGSGAMENSFLTVFNIFFTLDNVKPAMLLWRFITYYSCIIFGLFFVLSIKRPNNKSKNRLSTNIV